MIYECVDVRDLRLDERELAARLGAPIGTEIDGTSRLYEQLSLVAKPAYTAVRVNLSRQNGRISIGSTETESKALAELIGGGNECILLAATLGIGVDRLILKLGGISAKDAFITDAMADAMIEALCDHAETKITEGLTASGRFSPGYGDLELSVGKEILALTDAERILGIKLTESGLMIPRKSVNAIIAIRSR